MLWKNKKKKPTPDNQLGSIIDLIHTYQSRGESYVCTPIDSRSMESVKRWCAREGYAIELDHMSQGIMYYKIYGWR